MFVFLRLQKCMQSYYLFEKQTKSNFQSAEKKQVNILLFNNYQRLNHGNILKVKFSNLTFKYSQPFLLSKD